MCWATGALWAEEPAKPATPPPPPVEAAKPAAPTAPEKKPSPFAPLLDALRAQDDAMKKALVVGRARTPNLDEASKAAQEFTKRIKELPALGKSLTEDRRKSVEKESAKLEKLASLVDKYARQSEGATEATRFFRQLDLNFKGLQAQLLTP